MLSPNPEKATLATVATIILLLSSGLHIPLPGIDIDFLRESGRAYAAQFSILALGMTPLITVLAYAEIAKLAFPSLAQWQTRNIAIATLILCAFTFMLAAFHGYQIMLALRVSGVETFGAVGFMPVGGATIVGGTAVLIGLAKNAGFRGISGFWLLYMILALLGVMDQIAAWTGYAWNGEVSIPDVLTIAALLLVATGLVTFACLLLRREGQLDGSTSVLLLWPSILAGTIANQVFTLASLPASPAPFEIPYSWEIIYLLTALIVIPLCIHLYARTLAHRVQWPVIVTIAAIQIIIAAGALLLDLLLQRPFYLSGSDVIVISVVTFAIANPTTKWPMPTSLLKR